MKKSKLLLLTGLLGLALTACGDTKEPADTSSGSNPFSATNDTSVSNDMQDEPQTTEPLPASQVYLSSDGTYQVILLENLTQSDMIFQAGSTMMELVGGSDRSSFSALSLGSSKSAIPGNPDDVENLEDYADHINHLIFDGSGVTVTWDETDAPSAEGADQCYALEGTAWSGASRGDAYGYYAKSADCYFAIIIIGNDEDVEEARQVLSLEILDGTARQAGTKDFINSMTTVLDSINGTNLRETFKMLAESGAEESQLTSLASQARQSLSVSWGVESTDDLMEMADWLMNEGHNQNALAFLHEFNGTSETDRDAFDARLQEENLDMGSYVSLLAAYDAWSAYGEGAIAAWDLSRVGTIMSFGYAAGYCTYEEAMDKILEAAQKAQTFFGSWHDFNRSYLYGYSYWAEESLEDAESSAAARAELIDSMESQSNGPFSIEWDMDLQREW
ncbi:MAG: DUF1266 domain-containing protein [Clostridium sp.]|nr:DUF1266 domain-containing protein [Clostridium sp.]